MFSLFYHLKEKFTLTTLFYCETQKTLNTRNAMLLCCKVNNEETKPQTQTVMLVCGFEICLHVLNFLVIGH